MPEIWLCSIDGKYVIIICLRFLQPHVKSVEDLQSDYDRLQSLKISLEKDLLDTPDPIKVEDSLREVELRMKYIEYEILKRQHMEQ